MYFIPRGYPRVDACTLSQEEIPLVVSLALFITLCWVEEDYPRVKIDPGGVFAVRAEILPYCLEGKGYEKPPYLSSYKLFLFKIQFGTNCNVPQVPGCISG